MNGDREVITSGGGGLGVDDDSASAMEAHNSRKIEGMGGGDSGGGFFIGCGCRGYRSMRAE